MHFRMIRVFAMVIMAALFPLCARAADPASLAVELRSLRNHIEYGKMPPIPESWAVEMPERQYTVSTAPLRDLLTPPQSNLRLDQARRWLDHLASELEAASSDVAGASDARKKLDGILAQQMYAGIRPPTAMEQFRRRVIAWIQQEFARLFQFMADYPAGGYILFWLLIAGVGGWMVVWLIRYWQQDLTVSGLPPAALPARAIRWNEWLKAAREAVDKGDTRLAIHCVYWAAISHLEESGALAGVRANTPREVLRVVAAGPGLALREPLSALTTKFERFWYAGNAAGPDDFRESLRNLEALGCKVQ